MNISKAYCIELERSINIVDARNFYFAQKKPATGQRKKLTFLCSSPICREDEGRPVKIIGVNHYRIAEDPPTFRRPYFRSYDVTAHSPDCKWVIEDEKRQKEIGEAADHKEKSRLVKEYKDGYIQHATFLKPRKHSSKTDDKNKQSDEFSENDESYVSSAKPQIRKRVRHTQNIRTSGSFSKLVSEYLEIHENKEWETPLDVYSLNAKTYGELFRFMGQFDSKFAANHIHYGSVHVSKLLPEKSDFTDELPNAVILKFDQEVTVGETTAHPTLLISRKMFESTPSAHVLAETIKIVLRDDDYSDHLWCHFYGEIVEDEVTFIDKKTGEPHSFMTLKVKPKEMDMLELILRSKN